MRRAIGQIRDYLFGGGHSNSVSNAVAVTRQTAFGQKLPPTRGRFPTTQCSGLSQAFDQAAGDATSAHRHPARGGGVVSSLTLWAALMN